MAQITYRANLSAKTFPFISENFGRSVIVSGPDQNFSRQLVAPEDTDKDIGIPQVYYCHNIMPHTSGLQSVGYNQITQESDYYGENPNNTFKNIYLLRDGASNIAYLGITKNGYFYITDSTGAGWVQKKPIATYDYTSALKIYPELKDIGSGKLTWMNVGGATFSQLKAISGDGSLKLDGTGYITPVNAVNANTVFSIGTNDFVKSIWAYPEDISGTKTVWSRSTSLGTKIALEIQEGVPTVVLRNSAGVVTTITKNNIGKINFNGNNQFAYTQNLSLGASDFEVSITFEKLAIGDYSYALIGAEYSYSGITWGLIDRQTQNMVAFHYGVYGGYQCELRANVILQANVKYTFVAKRVNGLIKLYLNDTELSSYGWGENNTYNPAVDLTNSNNYQHRIGKSYPDAALNGSISALKIVRAQTVIFNLGFTNTEAIDTTGNNTVVFGSGVDSPTLLSAVYQLPVNTWTQFTVSRSFNVNVGTITLKINGLAVGSSVFASDLTFDSSIPETIGAQVISGTVSQGFIGYLDNFAYSKNSSIQPELLTNLNDSPEFAESKALITTAYVSGITYIYVEKTGCCRYDFELGTFVDVELTGLVAQNIIGITSSSGYLIAWSDTNISWSSSIDPTDFTPSLETGAGGGPVEAAKGSINYCVAHTLGFIVGTDDNCIAALYQNNSRYPFLFREIVGSGGMSSLDLISMDANSSALYAYTTSGIQLINTSQTQTVLPEITDFISGRYFEDFDDTSNTFSHSYLSSALEKKLTVIADRYLIVSYGMYELTHALVYDLVLKRYGKLKFTHVACFTYKIATDTIKEIPRQSIAFLTKDGSIYILDLSIASKSLNGTLMLGKYQYVRSRLLQLDSVVLESSRANQDFDLKIMPSLDGKTTTIVDPYPSSVDGLQKEYLCREIGANHSLLIKGGFLIDSLLLTFSLAGKR